MTVHKNGKNLEEMGLTFSMDPQVQQASPTSWPENTYLMLQETNKNRETTQAAPSKLEGTRGPGGVAQEHVLSTVQTNLSRVSPVSRRGGSNGTDNRSPRLWFRGFWPENHHLSPKQPEAKPWAPPSSTGKMGTDSGRTLGLGKGMWGERQGLMNIC